MTMTRIKEYTKKPVSIEAIQITDEASKKKAVAWIADSTLGLFSAQEISKRIMEQSPLPESGVTVNTKTGRIHIITLEGLMEVSEGDFVILGLAGEFYPCKPEIFKASYDEVREWESTMED